ncbi:hypothetical protein [Hymenobacter koreensis]|uniref:Uncharacterized protein n=1 Tax=Hymenobacter koreensis TaxID=1084523 RepID=A0ABP8J490_9BACT
MSKFKTPKNTFYVKSIPTLIYFLFFITTSLFVLIKLTQVIKQKDPPIPSITVRITSLVLFADSTGEDMAQATFSAQLINNYDRELNLTLKHNEFEKSTCKGFALISSDKKDTIDLLVRRTAQTVNIRSNKKAYINFNTSNYSLFKNLKNNKINTKYYLTKALNEYKFIYCTPSNINFNIISIKQDSIRIFWREH